jgi:hypothetical protein
LTLQSNLDWFLKSILLLSEIEIIIRTKLNHVKSTSAAKITSEAVATADTADEATADTIYCT